MLLPMTKTNLSTRKTVFGTTKQQEAFVKLCVLEGIPAVDAVKQVYSTTTHAASCASKRFCQNSALNPENPQYSPSQMQ